MGMFEVLSNPIAAIRQKLLPEPRYIKTVPSKDTPNEVLEQMPFDILLKMRDVYSDDAAFQKRIAPYEHKAFSKMLVEYNPAFWTPALAVMTPGYQAYKAAKRDYEIEPDATPVSLKQIKEGYKGIWEGLQKKPQTKQYEDLYYKDPFGDTTK